LIIVFLFLMLEMKDSQQIYGYIAICKLTFFIFMSMAPITTTHTSHTLIVFYITSNIHNVSVTYTETT